MQWFKFIHQSPKPRMTETPVHQLVNVAYSPIASMNYQWTINLHDGYPLLQFMQPEGYIPPSLHTFSNHRRTMFHLGDAYICPTKILLPPGDNGETLEAAANEENEINDDLYKFGALNGHQRPPKAPDPNLKKCKYNALLHGSLGRRPINLSQLQQQMLQLLVHLMPREMPIYLLMAVKGSGTLQRGTNMIFQV